MKIIKNNGTNIKKTIIDKETRLTRIKNKKKKKKIIKKLVK